MKFSPPVNQYERNAQQDPERVVTRHVLEAFGDELEVDAATLAQRLGKTRARVSGRLRELELARKVKCVVQPQKGRFARPAVWRKL